MNFKNVAFGIISLGLLATSCSKKDAATSRELDGEWTLKSGTEKTVTTSYSSYGLVSGTETENYSYDGKNKTGTNDGVAVNSAYTVKISFDKKSSTYKRTVTSVNTYTSYTYAYVNYSYTYVPVTSTYTYTSVDEGDFYLNQKGGDTKKGTILSLKESSLTTTSTSSSGYTSTSTEEISDNNVSEVWYIDECTKKSLKVTGSYEKTGTSSSGTTTYKDDDVTSEFEIEFEK